MARIIALANQKGGVAKTTSTFNLGVALTQKGKKVLLIDLDSQASLTISVGLEPMDYEKNIVSVLKTKGVSIKDCILKINENLHIVTSIIDLATLEMELISRMSREKILDRAIEDVKGYYDYILIDCPPQLSILAINALSCADSVIIPVKTDYLAYRGVEQLMDTIKVIQDNINPKLKDINIIATLYEMKVKDDREVLDYMKRNYNVIGIIKKTAAAKKGIYDGLSVVEKEPSSEISIEYKRIADMIISNSYARKEF